MFKFYTVDFWSGFAWREFWLCRYLISHYGATYDSSSPDLLICSVFGQEAQKYSCIKILVSGENLNHWSHPLNLADYDLAILCQKDITDELARIRYVPFPVIFMNIDLFDRTIQPMEHPSKFACFVARHNSDWPGCAARRELFMHAASSHPSRTIEARGPCFNTDGVMAPKPPKLPDYENLHIDLWWLNHYRFNLCGENSFTPGYWTEKICQPFLAGVVPVYLTHRDNFEYINPRSGIYGSSFDDVPRMVERMMALTDDERIGMLSEPKFLIDLKEEKRKMVTEIDNIIATRVIPRQVYHSSDRSDDHLSLTAPPSNLCLIDADFLITAFKQLERPKLLLDLYRRLWSRRRYLAPMIRGRYLDEYALTIYYESVDVDRLPIIISEIQQLNPTHPNLRWYQEKSLPRPPRVTHHTTAYVINMDSRPDRMEKIRQQALKLNSIDIVRFSAIVGTPGWIHCGKSHQEIVRQAKERGDPAVLVVEDDVDIQQPELFDHRWTQLSSWLLAHPTDWDIFNGGPTICGIKPRRILDRENRIIELTHGLTTHFIYYPAWSYDRILAWNPRPTDDVRCHAIDCHINLTCRQITCTPFLAYQSPDFSDIMMKMTDETHVFKEGEMMLARYLEEKKS